jgi:hypothetical protein
MYDHTFAVRAGCAYRSEMNDKGNGRLIIPAEGLAN